MEDEHQKRISYSKSRANNRKGKSKKKTYEKHMSPHMENGNENENRIGTVNGNKKHIFKNSPFFAFEEFRNEIKRVDSDGKT